MTRTVSYFVFVARNGDGYTATCPSFPHLDASARSARVAYARLKVAVKSEIARRLSAGSALPRDPVIQTLTLRLDLGILTLEEELA